MQRLRQPRLRPEAPGVKAAYPSPREPGGGAREKAQGAPPKGKDPLPLLLDPPNRPPRKLPRALPIPEPLWPVTPPRRLPARLPTKLPAKPPTPLLRPPPEIVWPRAPSAALASVPRKPESPEPPPLEPPPLEP